jgi:hypothetical protein
VTSGSLRPGLSLDQDGAPEQRLESPFDKILLLAKAIDIESRPRDSTTFLNNE